jgi:hypothetical protein
VGFAQVDDKNSRVPTNINNPPVLGGTDVVTREITLSPP